MDPFGILLSLARFISLPLLVPWKFLESRFTSWEQMDDRERGLNRKIVYLRLVAQEYGYEPAHWQFLPAGTETEIYLRNLLANISEGARFLGQTSHARRAGQKYMALASLDSANRRINSAVRIALVGLMNEMIPYGGKWSPNQKFPDYLKSTLRQDQVNIQSSDRYEQLAGVVAIELWKAREPYLDDDGKRSLAEYLNILNAQR